MGTTMDPLASLMNTQSSAVALASVNNQGATKDEFLKLLVAELAHQDPLDPQKGADFVAQLAQFSSLEQTATTNQQLASIAAAQVASQRASLAGFIGKTIAARSSSVSLNGQGAPSVSAHLDGTAAKVQVIVSDASGNPVRTLTMAGQSAGDFPIVWDGTDDNGRPLAAGSYQVQLKATAAGGADVSGYVSVKGQVTGLDFAADGPHFRVGGTSVSPADIVSVNG